MKRLLDNYRLALQSAKNAKTIEDMEAFMVLALSIGDTYIELGGQNRALMLIAIAMQSKTA